MTAVGVGLGVGLIVALLAITNGVHRTAADLTHVGGADFGLYQSDVSDFTRSLLPETMAAQVAADPGVTGVAKVKLLVVRRHARLRPRPGRVRVQAPGACSAAGVGAVLAGDHSGKDVGETFRLEGRPFTVAGIYHSGDRFEDLGVVLPLRTVESLATRPGEVTSIGVTVKPRPPNAKAVAARLQRRFPGVAAITEPGQAIKVDTSSRLIISTGWIVSILALIVGGIGVHEHDGDVGVRADPRDRHPAGGRMVGRPRRGDDRLGGRRHLPDRTRQSAARSESSPRRCSSGTASCRG